MVPLSFVYFAEYLINSGLVKYFILKTKNNQKSVCGLSAPTKFPLREIKFWEEKVKKFQITNSYHEIF